MKEKKSNEISLVLANEKDWVQTWICFVLQSGIVSLGYLNKELCIYFWIYNRFGAMPIYRVWNLIFFGKLSLNNI